MGNARPCTSCATPYTPRQKNQRFCSDRCRARETARRQRAAGRKPSWTPSKTAPCAWCGLTYTTSRHNGTYCSNSCAAYGTGRARTTTPLRWTQCRLCQRWRPRGNTCPHGCTTPPPPPGYMDPRPCARCGTPFRPKTPAGYKAEFCSATCRRSEANRRRRALTGWDRWAPDTPAGRIRRFAIYERDNWNCQLCGQPVDRTATVPDSQAATLDHIVPLSLGGEDTEHNLQLAHFICNSRKGARTPHADTNDTTGRTTSASQR